MEIINCIQGSEQWHKERCGLVTSSNFSLKMQPEKYMYQVVYERITGNQYPTGYSNKSIEHGTDTEDSARAYYELRTGSTVNEVGLVKHNEYISASPDGLIDENALLDNLNSMERKLQLPQNKIQKGLVKIWTDILEKENEIIELDSDYFEIGGHSLNAIILAAKIHKKLESTISGFFSVEPIVSLRVEV